MKKMFSLILCLVLTISLTYGCGSDNEEKIENNKDKAQEIPNVSQKNQSTVSVKRGNSEGDTWTVLVYLCGTDLETNGAFASINIEEMGAVEDSDKVNVIVQTGGTEEWAIDTIGSEQIERHRITQGYIELVDSQPLSSMGDSKTLGEFLKWGVEAYPADKYMCVMWNHGAGSVGGIAFDELYNMDSLDLNEMAQGFSMAGIEFEVIGFDACLMATLETAAALTPYGKYMVASQEVEPGTGWDYSEIIASLTENSKIQGDEIGKIICDSFYEKCKTSDSESMATLSVIDLKQIPKLTAAFDKMAAEMKDFTSQPDKLKPFTQAMIKAESYGGNNPNEGYTNMVDLGDLTLGAKGILSKTGEEVLDEIFNTVVYKATGKSRQGSNGISVYAPLYVDSSELDSYAKIATSGEYLRFLEGYCQWNMPENTVVSRPIEMDEPTIERVDVSSLTVAQALDRKNYDVSLSMELHDDGYVVLSIDEGLEVVADVKYNLFYLEEESNSIMFLGSDYDLNSNDEGTVYWDNFRNVWPVINGNTCSMIPLEWGDNYILYTVPILLNGSNTNLRMCYYYDTASYEIIGTWDGIDESTKMSSKEVRKLKDGDEVEFVFAGVNLETEEAYTFTFGGFTVNGDITVEEAELFEGQLYFQYEIADIFGNIYESDFAIINSENGEITVELDQ